MAWLVKCVKVRRNDVALHIHSRFGRVREVLVHRVPVGDWDRVRGFSVPPDRFLEVMLAGSWLEVSAILRRPDE